MTWGLRQLSLDTVDGSQSDNAIAFELVTGIDVAAESRDAHASLNPQMDDPAEAGDVGWR